MVHSETVYAWLKRRSHLHALPPPTFVLGTVAYLFHPIGHLQQPYGLSCERVA